MTARSHKCLVFAEARSSTAHHRRGMLLSTFSCAGTFIQSPSQGATASPPPQQPAMYDAFAQTYDKLDDGSAASFLGFPKLRERMISSAEGKVLECGGGTGINLPYYEAAKVQELVMLDLSQGMLAEAKQKPTATLTTFVQGNVQQLPFPDDQFDTVVDTFSFCVYPDPARAAEEMARVLLPGGKILLLEHSRSLNKALGWYQDLTNEPVKALGKACAWNQRIVELIEGAGIQVISAEYSTLGTVVMIIGRKPFS